VPVAAAILVVPLIVLVFLGTLLDDDGTLLLIDGALLYDDGALVTVLVLIASDQRRRQT
jgi:hypothetical protein